MTPTPEQAAILSGFGNTTGNICVQALAGTGKTSTLLELVAQNPQMSFLYMAFNKDVKKEVEAKAVKLGLKNLKVRTQNGFCFELARGAGCNPSRVEGYLAYKNIISRLNLTGNDCYLASSAFEIMTRFMTSRDTEITMRHVPVEVKDKIYNNVNRFMRNATVEKVAQETDKRIKDAVRIAQRLFSSFDFRSDVMLHDVYVKLVQLHYNEIPVAEDFVLLDEAQDINPVFSDIISRVTARLIAVGDNNQAIYQFRGAQDYLKEMPAEATFSLTQSFRFLPEIADKANFLLQYMTDLRVKGFKDVEEEDTSAILCRTNVGCLAEALGMLDTKTKFRLEGGVDKKGFQMIENIVGLYNEDFSKVQHPDLKGLKSFYDFQIELEEDLLNSEWKTALRVIEKMGGYEEAVKSIQKIKNEQSTSKNAVVITTMHKSKGQEWNNVTIASDAENAFYKTEIDLGGKRVRTPIPFSEAPVMEKNLFYVAVTRAKRNLDLGLCERLFVEEEEEETANTVVSEPATVAA